MGKRGPKRERILFLDSGFLDDAKVSALTDGELRAWLRILLEQVRSANGSEIPGHAYGVSRKRIQKLIELGLVDDAEGIWQVHGWDSWNGRDAYKRFLNRERVRRHRGRPPHEM